MFYFGSDAAAICKVTIKVISKGNDKLLITLRHKHLHILLIL